MVRSAPNFGRQCHGHAAVEDGCNAAQPRMGPVAEKGIISVELVNQGPKELEGPTRRQRSRRPRQKPFKEVFQLSNSCRSDGEGPCAQQAEGQEGAAQEEGETSPKKRRPRSPPKIPRRWSRSRFRRKSLCLLMGDWRHIFFTYDGSGKASGIKIYVNGVPVETKTAVDTLAEARFAQKLRCSSAGVIRMRIPPSETRYQDIRLYGRALTRRRGEAASLRGLRGRDHGQAADEWNEDRVARGQRVLLQQHRPVCAAIAAQIAQLDDSLMKLSEGGDLTWSRGRSRR